MEDSASALSLNSSQAGISVRAKQWKLAIGESSFIILVLVEFVPILILVFVVGISSQSLSGRGSVKTFPRRIRALSRKQYHSIVRVSEVEFQVRVRTTSPRR